jgi:hypothetical protein
MYMKEWFILLAACIATLSCSKTKVEDKEPPSVSLLTPSESQFIPAGEVVIKGMVTDNAYIGQIHVEINNVRTTVPLSHVHIHPGTAKYALNFPITLQAGMYNVKVTVEDPAYNTVIKEINFVVI